MTLNRKRLLKFITNSDNELPYTKINEFMDYIHQNDLHKYTNKIYNEKKIKNLFSNDIDNSRWKKAKYLLKKVENTNCHYLIDDNQGNFKNITNADINNIIYSIICDLDRNDIINSINNDIDKNKDSDYEI